VLRRGNDPTRDGYPSRVALCPGQPGRCGTVALGRALPRPYQPDEPGSPLNGPTTRDVTQPP
jgi:hypothetical protein